MQSSGDLDDGSETNNPDLLAKKDKSQSPLKQLVNTLLPSRIFRKLLRLGTGLVLKSHDVKARRFRHGNDYQLATAYLDENSRLEITLEISREEKCEGDKEAEIAFAKDTAKEKEGKDKGKKTESKQTEDINNGGYEVWIAGDDDDGPKVDAGETQEEPPQGTQNTATTSAGEGGSSSDVPNSLLGSSAQDQSQAVRRSPTRLLLLALQPLPSPHLLRLPHQQPNQPRLLNTPIPQSTSPPHPRRTMVSSSLCPQAGTGCPSFYATAAHRGS